MIALRGGNTGALVPPAILVSGLALLGASVVSGAATKPALAISLLATVIATYHKRLFAWTAQVNLIVAIVLFIPMRRYALPASLPFQLDPYRVILAVVVLGWIASLLVDVRVRPRPSIAGPPLVAIFAVAAASIAVNLHTLSRVARSGAIKELTFLAGYLFFFFLVVSVVRAESIDSALRVFVGCAGFVAAAAVYEFRSHQDIFDRVASKLPLLHQTAAPLQAERGGHLRVLASAQHPIALGALFAMAVPLALYLYSRYGEKRWLFAIVLFGMGAAATGSRTAIVMLVVVVFVYLVLRPRQTLRLWPAIIPIALVIHFAMPGTIGSFYKLFFPKGGLVAEQADAGVGSSRVASFGPGLHLIGLDPLLGGGFGGRVFNAGDPSAFIVDDQWLSTGIDTGILGVSAWAWFFLRFLRPTFRAARREIGSRGSFYTAVAASTTSFAVGMLTYDAFSFIQTTFVLFLVVALGSIALRDLAAERTR